jgi:hypothetical protein
VTSPFSSSMVSVASTSCRPKFSRSICPRSPMHAPVFSLQKSQPMPNKGRSVLKPWLYTLAGVVPLAPSVADDTKQCATSLGL